MPARVQRAYRRWRYGPGAFKVDLVVDGVAARVLCTVGLSNAVALGAPPGPLAGPATIDVVAAVDAWPSMLTTHVWPAPAPGTVVQLILVWSCVTRQLQGSTSSHPSAGSHTPWS